MTADAESNGRMNTELFEIFLFGGIAYVCLSLLFWFLGAQLSGWAELARYYRSEVPFEGERWRFRSCRTRWLAHYSGCVTLGVNADGLYLGLFSFFRIGHPPLFVPWHEVRLKLAKTIVWERMELRFNQAPDLKVTFYGRWVVTFADEVERIGKRLSSSNWKAFSRT
jgi:hypothetical protein